MVDLLRITAPATTPTRLILEGMYQPFDGDGRDDDKVAAALQAFRATTTHTGVLPPVVRWVSPNRRSVLLERAPQMVTIRFHGRPKAEVDEVEEQQYDIMLPWMAYAITVDHHNRPMEVYLFVLDGPLQANDQRLYDLPLTNLYPEGRFCLPDSYDYSPEPWDLGRGVATAVEMVWASSFNTDLTGMIDRAFQGRRPVEIMDFIAAKTGGRLRTSAANILKAWADITEQDANAPVNFSWQPAGTYSTVGDIIAKLSAEEGGATSPAYLLTSLQAVFNGAT